MFIIFTSRKAKVVKAERGTLAPLSTIKASRPATARLDFESDWGKLKKLLKDRPHAV